MQIKTDGTWRPTITKAKVTDVWRDVQVEWTKVDGVWRSKPNSQPIAYNWVFETGNTGRKAVMHPQVVSTIKGIYSFGGRTASGVDTACYLDNSPIASPPAGLSHGCAWNYQNAVYVIGGLFANGSANTKMWRLTTENGNQWVEGYATATACPQLTYAPGALVNGVQYFASTRDSNVYSFNHSTLRWATIASASPLAAQLSKPDVSAGFVQVDNDLWITGGVTNNELWRYNVPNNTWSQLVSLPTEKLYGHQMFAYKGRLYTLGGLDATGVVEQKMFVYDVPTNAWSIADEPPKFTAYASRVTISRNALHVLDGSTDGTTAGLTNAKWKIADLPT